MKEIWKDIPDYEGYYQASNLGRIKSLSRQVQRGNDIVNIKEKILSGANDYEGYLVVSLAKNGISKTKKVHRLVAQTFIENPKNYPQINHRNEIKTDNRIENLEWCTNKYNVNYGNRNNVTSLKLSKKVIQYDKQHNQIKVWNSMKEAQNKLKIQSNSICACCQNKRKTAGGFIWRYVNER